jgi:hypothetical protein
MDEPVAVVLEGDFHRDIRGAVVCLSGRPALVDPAVAQEYMQGFASLQCGNVGDITAGKEPVDYVDYPYIEWYSAVNGRVVLELEPEQMRIVGVPLDWRKEEPTDVNASHEKCLQFIAGVARAIDAEEQ